MNFLKKTRLSLWLCCTFGAAYLWTNYVILMRGQRNNIKVRGEEKLDVSSDEMGCQCDNRTAKGSSSDAFPMSTCDGYATMRGRHQMVVSYTFHGDIGSVYFRGVSLNAQLVRHYYRGWVMRVYHNLDVNNNQTVRDALCFLWCKYHHLDFCPVNRLPAPLLDQSSIEPRNWRFYVLGDPLVDRLVSRDLDSAITEREMAAVGQWLTTGKTWHFMRDHPLHAYPIMGGMWGALNYNVSRNAKIRQKLFLEAQTHSEIGNDQPALRGVVLPIAEADDDYVNHDSFSCHEPSPKRSWPWPVKRQDVFEFVGAPVLRYEFPIIQTCPEQCRPINHKDWEYC